MCCNNSRCNCGCNFGRCTNLGPFVAVDADCITPPVAGRGSIIPFASGTPVTLTTVAGTLLSTAALIGFGTNFPGVTIVGNTIDLSALTNEAFSVPRAGTLSAISASFTIFAGLTLTGDATVNAQVYHAPAGSNTFTATGVSVNLAPVVTPLITVGTTLSGTASNFNFPVAAGDRLLMVISSVASGLTVAGVVIGTASAGLTIE